MAYIYRRDAQGNPHAFQISGNQPNASEEARISAALSQIGRPAPEDAPGILSLLGTGIGRGIDSAQAGIYTGLEGLAEQAEGRSLFGRTPEEYRELADEQRRQRDSSETGLEGGFFEQEGVYDKARYLALAGGESLPAMVGGAAAIGIGSLFGPGGTLAGTAVAASMYSPQILNENAERQIEQFGYVKDWGKAAQATAAGALVEGIADRFTLGVAGLVKRPLSGLMQKAVKEGVDKGLTLIAKRIGTTAALGAVSEMPTEVIQSALSRWQAEMPTDDEEAMAEYIEGAVVGGILGGTFGGAIGGIGGFTDARAYDRMAEARRDMEREREELETQAAIGPSEIREAYLSRYPQAEEMPVPQVGGYLPDRSAEQTREQLALQDLEGSGQSADQRSLENLATSKIDSTRSSKATSFSDDEYINAINAMRGESSFSPHKIRKALGVGDKKAKEIYQAMFDRNDAMPTGSAGYARVTTPVGLKSRGSAAVSGRVPAGDAATGATREYRVGPVDRLDQEPYTIQRNGKQIGGTFRTEEDARAWARDQKLDKFEIAQDTSGQQFGLYEDVFVDDKGERRRSSTRVVNTFSSAQEANRAAKELDPDYSPETNQALQKAAREDLAQRDRAEDLKGIEQNLQKLTDVILGRGRAEIRVVPEVGEINLRQAGVEESAIPKGNIIEGVTMQSRAKDGLRQIIMASADYYGADPATAEKKLAALVGGHEVVHALRNADLLKASEWKALDDFARNQKVPGKKYSWLERAQARNPDRPVDNEEAIAEMFRAYVENPTAFKAKERGLLKRLLDFVKKVMGLSRGLDGEQVMADILSGEFGKREIGAGGMGPRRSARDTFYSRIATNPFYLKTERFLEGIKQDKAPAKQWLGILKNAGVKKEEKEFLGLEDWLMDQGDTVLPKQELINFIKANSLEIVVDQKSQADADLVMDRALADFERAEKVLLDRWESETEEFRNRFFQEHQSSPEGVTVEYARLLRQRRSNLELFLEGDDFMEARRVLNNLRTGRGTARDPKAPQHPEMVQPGGSNYQELLIRIPEMKPEYVKESHFSDPNIIAHARTTDRMDGQEKGLFIEEIQSDLHQAGRRRGYLDNEMLAKKEELRQERQRLVDRSNHFRDRKAELITQMRGLEEGQRDGSPEYQKLYDAYTDILVNRENIGERINEIDEQLSGLRGVPDAPFKTSWEEFALKNLILNAVKNGYDFIAWHGEHDSVGATENYKIERVTDGFDNEGNEITDEKFLIDPSGQNVTSIVNRYLQKMPRIAKQLGQKFGAILEVRDPAAEAGLDASPAVSWETLEQAFPNAGQLNAAAREMREEFQIRSDEPVLYNMTDDDLIDFAQLVEFWEASAQAAINQRTYDIERAFADVPVEAINDGFQILRGIDATPQKGTGTGAYRFRHYRLPITDQMREAFLKEDIPRFSMVPQRKQQLMMDPSFQKWFEGSIVRDPSGAPQVMYHGTPATEDFSEFFPLSHFGTLQAAHDRLAYVLSERHPSWYNKVGKFFGIDMGAFEDWFYGLTPENRLEKMFNVFPETYENTRIYPVMLSIKKPVMVRDDEVLGGVYDLANALEEAGVFTESEVLRATAQGDKSPNVLIRILENKGYDAIAYENAVEDAGSISYIPLRQNQIKSIFNTGDFSFDTDNIQFSAVPTADAEYSATAPMGQRVPLTPPKSTIAQVENQMAYNNVAPVLQKYLGKLPGRLSVKAPRIAEDTFIAMQDRMLSVGDLVDRVRKNGGFITNENDTYLREQLFSGQTEERLNLQKKGFYDPLVEAVKHLPVSKADAEEAAKIGGVSRELVEEYSDPRTALAELYLYAQHAIERNAVMRERNSELAHERPDQYDAGSGMPDGDARAILSWFQSKSWGSKFSDLNDPNSIRSLFRKLIASTNDVRVQGGLNPDFRTMVGEDGMPIDRYQDYAPLRGFIEEHFDGDWEASEFAKTGRGYRIAGKEDMSALGRRRLAADIIGHAILQNEEAVIRAEKNRVAQSFVNLIRQNDADMELGHVGRLPMASLGDIAEIIEVRPMRYTYDRRTGKVRKTPDPSTRNDDSILIAKEDGKEVLVKIHDPRIAKAMNKRSTIGPGAQGAILSSLMNMNRFLGAMRTSYNPEFMISNMLRDLEAAFTNLNEIEVQGIKKEIISQVYPSIKGVWSTEISGNIDTEWAKIYADFRKHGGKTAFYGLRELSDTITQMNRAMAEKIDGGNLGKAKRAFQSVANFIEAANSGVENGIRIATFKTLSERFLSEAGNDPAEIRRAKERAAFIAKNLTVNFNMGGDAKPFMNSMYLFYNASMQGSLALINPMIRSKRVRRIWGGIFAAGLMQDLLMSMMSPEDDDGIKQYDKIPEYVLEHNLVYMDPFGLSERGYFKIPLPYLLNGIYNAGRAISAGLRGKYTPGETVNSVGGVMLSSLDPFGGGNTFLNFVAPTVVDPIVDLTQNMNFAGAPISPPENPFGTSPKDSQRYWNNTSPIYVTIADWLSRLSGGEGDYLPGRLEYSPNTIEYWMEWLGGGAWTFVQRTYDLAAPPPIGQGTIYEMLSGGDWSVNDIPGLRRAYGNVSSREDLQFYIENRDQIMKVRAEMRDALKDGDAERYAAITQRYPKEYRVASRINQIESQRKQLSRQIKQVRNAKGMSDERKEEIVRRLKERQEELVGQANSIIRGG